MTTVDTTTAHRATYQRRVEQLQALLAEHDFAAAVVADVGTPPQQAYARHLSGLNFTPRIAPTNHVVVVPREGEPTVVIPPGIRRSIFEYARARSWISDVVHAEYLDDPKWELKTRWGLLSSNLGPTVAQALGAAGGAEGRIAVAGTWAGIDETKALLPKATFEPTLVNGTNGSPRDLLAPLIAASSAWEVERAELAYGAADAAALAFMEAARSGASTREARIAAETAALRAGVDDIVLVGSIGVEPWAFWEWLNSTHDEFGPGKLYFIEVARCGWFDFGVQSARSFTVGAPTKAQLHLIDTIKRALEAIYAEVEIGKTGADLFTVGWAIAEKAGLEPWAQFGHNKGLTQYNGMSLLPDSKNTVYEGQLLTVHPCLRDPKTGDGGMAGDTILIESDGWRHLRTPLSLDLT